jgi:hypothetical protein
MRTAESGREGNGLFWTGAGGFVCAIAEIDKTKLMNIATANLYIGMKLLF